jgi:hypothetical protein
MSLPCKVIDRLFDRLTVTYGAQFMRAYEGQQPAAVKSSWAHELAGFENRLDAVAWALEMLPDRCPNVIEFRRLCRAAPSPGLPQLPDAKADPARLAVELAKLGGVKNSVIGAKDSSGKQWAHDLQGRIERREIMPTLFQRDCITAAPQPESES